MRNPRSARAYADQARHEPFPKDPADRIVYATAVHHGIQLLTRDSGLLEFDRRVCRW